MPKNPIEHSFPVLGVNVLHSVCLTPFAKTVAVYKFHQVRVIVFLGKWGEAHTMKYIDPKNREAVFNWITDLYVKHFTKVPLVINYHRWMGAGKDWAGEENFDPDSKRLLDSACEKGFS